jgi:hypothetical protein
MDRHQEDHKRERCQQFQGWMDIFNWEIIVLENALQESIHHEASLEKTRSIYIWKWLISCRQKSPKNIRAFQRLPIGYITSVADLYS